jgi:hypothetical protein
MRKHPLSCILVSAAALVCATVTSTHAAAATAQAPGHEDAGAVPAVVASHSSPLRPAIGPPKGTCNFTRLKGDTGAAASSQNFPDQPQLNSAGADDFAFKKPCSVATVDVVGQYSDSGPATSVNVIFYADDGGRPGSVYDEQDNLAYVDSQHNGTFSINISPVLFDDGIRYWVSVVANMPLDAGGQWFWELSGQTYGLPSMWENPGGGFRVCPTWGTTLSCLGVGNDYMFQLSGTPSNYKFIPIYQPDEGGYETGSCAEPLSQIPDGTILSELTPLECKVQHREAYSVNFSTQMEKLTAGTAAWPNWGIPPNTESSTPPILYTMSATSVTLSFSGPVKLGGIEAQPEPETGTHLITADFYSGGVLLGSIPHMVDSNGGALLFGAHCLHLGWGRIVITSDVPFAIAELRV